MAANPDELKREIEVTRGNLGETLDAIGDRVSPGRMMERRKNRVTYGVRSIRDRVMGTASNATHTVADDASSMAHSVGDTVSGAASTVVDTVKSAPQTVTQQTQGAPLVAGAIAFGIGFMAAAAFPASHAEEAVGEKLMEKAEPLKDELTSTVKEAAGEVADHLKGPAMDAASDLGDSAKESVQQVTAAASSGD
jgi:hypothetical protein